MSFVLTNADIAAATLAAEAVYYDDPEADFLSVSDSATGQGLSAVDLTAWLPQGSGALFDAGGLYQGGQPFIDPGFSSNQSLRDAFASALLERPVFGARVSDFQSFLDDRPAEAVALISDGSGDGQADTLYLSIRGTDNIADAAVGGQAYTAEGQAAYFQMLLPFFQAALAYAQSEGLARIVVTGGSLGGSMADLFSLFLKPEWDSVIEVGVVSIASAGVADGTVAVLGDALGVPLSDRPVLAADGTYARPEDHLNFENTEDVVPNPDVLPTYLVAQQLLDNAPIAGWVSFDQVTLDGTRVDFLDNTFGDEHEGVVYIATMLDLVAGLDGAGDANALAGSGWVVGGAEAEALATGGLGGALGMEGNDSLTGGAGAQTLMGGAGDDMLEGGAGGDLLIGGEGYDTATWFTATRSVRVDLQNPAISFGDAAGDVFVSIEEFRTGAGIDQLRGDAEGNIFYTGAVSDRLYGRAGDDTLFGEAGADAFYGGLGADVMTGGDDAGRRDRYIYFNAAESGVGAGNRDVITDFVAGEDRIELSRIDADLTQGFKQGFDFIGNAGFSGAGGELRFEQSGGNTIVQADRDGDGLADFEIELTGLVTLTEADFLI